MNYSGLIRSKFGQPNNSKILPFFSYILVRCTLDYNVSITENLENLAEQKKIEKGGECSWGCSNGRFGLNRNKLIKSNFFFGF